jgi:tetratricopeptide (TPR) repeat protein
MKIMGNFGFPPTGMAVGVSLALFSFGGQFLPAQSVTTNRPLTAADIAGIQSESWRLYFEGKLVEAYEAAQREAKENPSDLWGKEWQMGRVQERFGHLAEALGHFQTSLAALRARGPWSITNLQGVRNFTRNELALLDNVAAMYAWQGKMGLATRTRAEITNIMEMAAAEIAEAERLNCVDCVQVFEGLRAEHFTKPFAHQGACPDTCVIFRKIGDRADAEKRYQLARDVYSSWAAHLAFFEQYPEALELRRKIEPLPFDRRYIYRADLLTIELAESLARREGVTDEVWALLEPALARLESPPHHNNWFLGTIIKARLLDQAGRSAEALALLDRISKSTREKHFQPQLAASLEARARIKLGREETAGVEADVKESLQIYRTLGKKEIEPNLYELYARLLGRQRQYEKAVQTWEQGFAICENLKLHFRSLHFLLGLGELQSQQRRFAELDRTWRRIGEFVARHHHELPEPTMLRFHLACLDYLKGRGTRSELLAANDAAHAFASGSKLSRYQLREFARWQEAFPGVTASLRPSPPVTPITGRRPTWDLQPILVKTRVRTNEIARAYFTLSNPSSETATGTIQLRSDTFRFACQTNEHGLLLKLIPDVAGDNGQQEIEVPPGQEILLSVECDPDVRLTNYIVTLRPEGRNQKPAQWDFGFGDDARSLAVVNASLAEDNPFYSLSFFHDVYFRGETEILTNLRVQASEPCRVEIVDALSRLLLAIDANGDGDFEDAGDAFYTDGDLNGYPDFKVSAVRDVQRFEVVVFPHFKQKRNRREIEVTLSLSLGNTWTPQAVDKLIIQ